MMHRGIPKSPVEMISASPNPSGGTLFDKYAANDPTPKKLFNHQTHTSRLRAQGIKLICYLNTEVDSGRSVVVHLPEAEDTIEEVLPYIQIKMQLDKRMKYAQGLYTPDGNKIQTWDHLTSAAAAEIPIIVTCGEKFDALSVPQTMVAFQEHGGGRNAAQQTKHELQERRKKVSQQQAAAVRATGHGTQSSASKAARIEAVEKNRNQATEMRHEFMENLLVRSAQQEELVKSVKLNNERRRAEREERRAKVRMEASTGVYELSEVEKRNKELRIKKKLSKREKEEATAKVLLLNPLYRSHLRAHARSHASPSTTPRHPVCSLTWPHSLMDD